MDNPIIPISEGKDLLKNIPHIFKGEKQQVSLMFSEAAELFKALQVTWEDFSEGF